MNSGNEISQEIDNLLEVKLEKPLGDVRIVHRPRLTERLTAGLKQRLTLLVAPTGYGKTTLLVEWLALAELENWHTVWITLDEFNNSPLRFWAYLTFGIKKFYPGLRFNPQQLAQESGQEDGFSALNPFINEIASILSPIILVLDNYHTITDPTIHASIEYLIEHQPPNLHLVLSGRSMPPISISRLRAQRQMVEINTQHLSFTVPEAETFLKEIMDLDLEFEQVSALMEATEGWPAGLQLVALTYQSRESLQNLHISLPKNNRLIVEYLTEEVLNQQSPEIKEFLLKTSILEEMCSPLCDHILGKTNSQEILVWLEQSNLFTTCLDEHQYWYRYHSLFGEALKTHLERTYPELIQDLHRKAFEWLQENGIPYKAVSHALAAGDLKEAAEILDQSILDTFHKFDLNNLVQWMGHFSSELFLERPQLVIYNALANYHLGRKDKVEVNLNQVNELLEKANELSNSEKEIIKWQAAALRTTLRLHDGVEHQEIDKLTNILDTRPADIPYFLSFLTFSLAHAQHRAGDFEASAKSFTQVCQFALQNDDPSFFTHALVELGKVRKLQGRLGQAQREFTKALNTAYDSYPDPGTIALCQIGLLEIALEQNDLEKAREIVANLLDNYHELLESQSVSLSLDLIASRLLEYFLAVEDIDHVKTHFKNMMKYLPEKRGNFPGMPWELIDVHVRAEIFMRKHNLEHHLPILQAHLESIQNPSILEQIALSQVYLAHRMHKAAQSVLEKLAQKLRKMEFSEYLTKTLVLLSLAYYAQRDEEAAFETIEEALLIATPEHYIRVFIDVGDGIKDLLEQFTQKKLRGSDDEAHKKLLLYSNNLIQEMNNIHRTAIKPITGTLPQARMLTTPDNELTEREMEVLQLLVAGNTYKEMAKYLMISVNTVKAHVKHIYRKLDTSSRKGIYERARELGLIK